MVANNAADLRDSDALSFEFPWKISRPPDGNALPAEVCDTIQTGARWFWREARQPSDLQEADVIAALAARLQRARFKLPPQRPPGQGRADLRRPTATPSRGGGPPQGEQRRENAGELAAPE